jgi:DNA-binding NarL/FixJ family response regulator
LVVGSPSFSRIVKHLFHGQSEFEVVGALSGFGSLGRQAGQLLPDLIVANVKPVSVGIRRVVAAIKQASPSAKVILTCPVEDFARAARKHGADACLNDENVAGRLLRMAFALSNRPKAVNAGN